MADVERSIPAPIRGPDNQPFWDAASEHRLMIKHCIACEKSHFYPCSLCPFCFSGSTKWVQASGHGMLYTFSVVRRAEPPYVIAFVTLDEGVSMMTNVVDADFDALRIGQRVELIWRGRPTGHQCRCSDRPRARTPVDQHSCLTESAGTQ